jgi:predicted transcriptional regulator
VQKRAGNTLEATGIGKDFLSRTQMAQQLRERIHKWDSMKLKSSCITKEMVSKLKRLPTEWENIFASYTPDKVQITRIYWELKKTIRSHKGNANQNTLRLQLTSVRIATIKNTNNNKC